MASLSDDWRNRLRAAVERSGRKHSDVASRAGIAAQTLSRILRRVDARPGFDTVVSIAHAANENVGWLLDEPGFRLSVRARTRLRNAGALILGLVSGADCSAAEQFVNFDSPIPFADFVARAEDRGAAVRVP